MEIMPQFVFLLLGLLVGSVSSTWILFENNFYEFFDFKTYLLLNSFISLIAFLLCLGISKIFKKNTLIKHQFLVGFIFSFICSFWGTKSVGQIIGLLGQNNRNLGFTLNILLYPVTYLIVVWLYSLWLRINNKK